MKYSLYALLAIFFFTQCNPKTGETIGDLPAKPSIEKPGVEEPSDPADLKPDPENFRSSAPKPAPAREIQLGTYESFKLDNGLTVILVENHKIPRISWQLSLDYDPILEGEKAGYTSMAGDLLMRGTESKTKAEIDEAVDFLGASLNAGAGGMFASSLTRHTTSILDLMTDVLYNPSFPESEFEKLKNQTISSIQSSKDDPNSISGNLAAKLNYAGDHPYGELVTEESVLNISIDDCKAFYNSYYRPNIAYLVVVGDISLERTKKVAEKYFGKWEYRKVKENKVAVSQGPDETEVAFVNKPGAVQSVIRITYPVVLQPGSKDRIPARVMNGILGAGGFSSRLLQNLREDKAYTYGAGSALVSDEIVGEFRASASVRNSVTDSAIVQFLYEMNRIRDEKVNKEDLQKIKNIISGSFARSLERPQTIANFALNTALYDLPEDYYAKYLQTLNEVTSDDIQRMARKYIKPEAAYITIVGNKDEVAEKLGSFAKSGKVDFYDFYGEPVKESNVEISDDLTADMIVENYIKAIGGRKALSNITDMTSVAQMATPQGTLMVTISQKEGNKLYQKMEGMGMTLNEVKFDGEKGVQKGMMGNGPLDGDVLESTKEDAIMLPELDFAKYGFSAELKGVEQVDGQDAYKLQITGPSGNSFTEFYAVESGLRLQKVSSATGPDGSEVSQTFSYSDYKEVDGILFPHQVSVGGQKIEIQEIKLNTGLSDELFTVE